MKRILTTGANSYIGMSFENYLKQWPDKYQVDTVDMIDGTWRETSFNGYDAVFHVAGIAHSDTRKISQERENLYYSINTDLAIETAEKASADGVKQFILMSSATIYGDSAPIGKTKVITKDTPVSPANFYGDSKVQAENGILPLQSSNFNVVVLRPPMIYGPNSKGNYQTLVKLALKLPFFPYIENQRSMLHIDNLCAFVKHMIDSDSQGIFWPQDAKYVNTSEMVKSIAKEHGKRIRLVKGFKWLLVLMSHFTGLVNKAFGSFCYDTELSTYKRDYDVYSLSDSMERIVQSK